MAATRTADRLRLDGFEPASLALPRETRPARKPSPPRQPRPARDGWDWRRPPAPKPRRPGRAR